MSADSARTILPAAILRGAKFGAAEAAQTAGLTGSSFELTHVAHGSLPADTIAHILRTATVIISAIPHDRLTPLAGSARILVLEVLPVPDTVPCTSLVLRVSAPARDLAHARLWDPSLVRFGAQQLNERYRRATGNGLTSEEWLGWMAAKLAFELPLRARSVDADSIAAFARSPRARFDGHKGRALAFDPATGVLAQPLYVHAPDAPLGPPEESESRTTAIACRAQP